MSDWDIAKTFKRCSEFSAGVMGHQRHRVFPAECAFNKDPTWNFPFQLFSLGVLKMLSSNFKCRQAAHNANIEAVI